MAKISCTEAQIVASCERPKGLSLLRQALGWEPFDEADKPALAILLDFHYDNLMFCVKKGFPWHQICSLVDMAAVVAEQCKGKNLGEAIKIYQKECYLYSSSTSEQYIKQFTEYFFETFMRHYQLYQYVFSREQEPMIIKVQAQVETPTSPLPFTEAKPLKVWEYEQKVKDVETAEEMRQKEHEEEEIRIKQEREEAHKKMLEKLQNVEQPVEREAIVELINDIAAMHLSAAGHAIKQLIDRTTEDLEFKLLKTTIPRPQELGPPPRYKTKTPVSAMRRPKSVAKDKPAKKDRSRGSSRASNRSKAT